MKPRIRKNPTAWNRFTGEKVRDSWVCGDSFLSGWSIEEAYQYWVNWQNYKFKCGEK